MEIEQLKDRFIEDFGNAYASWGMNRLKGRIVGLLIISTKPLSLDNITEALHVSKGPVSTITRQLEESGLVRKVWIKGDRKDYYEIVDSIFVVSFQNNIRLIENNIKIADRYISQLSKLLEENPIPELEIYLARVNEMKEFNEKIVELCKNFILEWGKKFELKRAVG